MRTALVNLSDSGQLEMPPLGLLQVATSIERNSKTSSVHVADLLVDRNDEATAAVHANSILNVEPDLVCITVFTAYAKYVKCLISELRKNATCDLKIAIGGPHVTTTPDSSARFFDADYAVVGPGELVILNILDSIKERKTSSLPGVKQRKSLWGTDLIFADPESTYEFSDPVEVNRSLVDLCNYSVPFTLTTSIGCSGKCIFCASPAINHGRIYVRSISSISNEITSLVQHNDMRRIAILDDSFTLSRERTLALCSVLREHGLKWFCESRVDIMDTKLLNNMSDSGCTEIQFGVECFDESLLRKIGKNVKPDQIVDTIKCALDNGIRVAISLMLGLPFDTLDSMKNRVDKACELASLGVSVIEFGYLKPYPGTYLYEHRDKFGYQDADVWWEKKLPNPLCFVTDTFSKSELLAMMMYANYKVQVESDAFCHATVKECT